METSEIIKRLKDKSIIKYETYDNTLAVFEMIKKNISSLSNELRQTLDEDGKHHIPVSYKEKGIFEVEMRVAADLVMFSMHSNIFNMPGSHFSSQLKYVKDDPYRGYCGIINIYNFLADSFKYDRYNDIGYLIGRIFINKDNHFFVEGKKQLGFLFNDFTNQVIDEKAIKEIINTAVIYSIDLDLITPSIDEVKEVRVGEMVELNSTMSLKTGKKLGFRFSFEKKPIK